MAVTHYKSINDFAVAMTKKEGLKKSISIAQVKEILRILNDEMDGYLYKIIKGSIKHEEMCQMMFDLF